MVFVRNLRAMIFRAIDNEWLVKDPFRRYEYKNEETTREILTKEEIHLLMETPITRKHMGLVRDLYLFCCFTGLAFIDLYNLKEENIKTFLTMASGLLSTDRRQERKPTSSCLTIPSR